MANNLGRSGYTYATIEIQTGFSYSGGGIAGMGAPTGTFLFNVRERNKEVIRDRQDTTDSAYKTGVPGPVGLQFKIMGYFKGEFVPDSSWQGEYIYVDASVCLRFVGIVLVERFREVGVIDGAIHYEIEGMTDNVFANQNIAGA